MTDDLFSKTPRGLRNNNWLNIKFNPCNHWKGQIGNDGTFCIFIDPVFGIRAAYKILKSYLKRKPDLTLKEFIFNWSSTDRDSYLKFIQRKSPLVDPWLSWKPMSSFSKLDLVYLFHCMALFENGVEFHSFFKDTDIFVRGVFMS